MIYSVPYMRLVTSYPLVSCVIINHAAVAYFFFASSSCRHTLFLFATSCSRVIVLFLQQGHFSSLLPPVLRGLFQLPLGHLFHPFFVHNSSPRLLIIRRRMRMRMRNQTFICIHSTNFFTKFSFFTYFSFFT